MMTKEIFDSLDKKGLIHPYNPRWSKPEQFIDLIKQNGKTTYRSTFFMDFTKFRPFNYFVVLFAEKGSRGKITAWGICKREACERVDTKYDSSPFLEAKYGLKGDKYSEFKSLFYYVDMGLFNKPLKCFEFTLIKTGEKIADLRLLRSALYVEIPQEIIDEIKKGVK